MNSLWESNPTVCVLLIFVAFFLVVVIVSIIKKLYYRFRWHKRYYIIPRVGIRGITSIAMTIALTVAIILVLAFLTAGLLAILFRAYPGWRIVIEQFLIQLGGLLFGPFIGLIIGALTDLLTVALTSGMFHYGYFIICMAYGLIGGLISSLLNNRKKYNLVSFSLWSTIIMAVLTAAYCLYIRFRGVDVYTISVFALDLSIGKYIIIWIVSGFMVLSAAVVWIILGICRHEDIKLQILKMHYNVAYNQRAALYRSSMKMWHYSENSVWRQTSWYARNATKMYRLKGKIEQLSLKAKSLEGDQHWYDSFIPTIVVCSIAQLVCNCFMLPYFDVQFSAIDLNQWIALRSLLFPFLLALNLLIIFPSYMAIKKLISYDYRSDELENINVPYMVD